jgi:hypothetical protein
MALHFSRASPLAEKVRIVEEAFRPGVIVNDNQVPALAMAAWSSPTLCHAPAFDTNTGELMGEIPEEAMPIGKSARVLLDLAYRDHDPRKVGRNGCRPNVMVLCQSCAQGHSLNTKGYQEIFLILINVSGPSLTKIDNGK